MTAEQGFSDLEKAASHGGNQWSRATKSATFVHSAHIALMVWFQP
jgi:hypothetical protein